VKKEVTWVDGTFEGDVPGTHAVQVCAPPQMWNTQRSDFRSNDPALCLIHTSFFKPNHPKYFKAVHPKIQSITYN
jgi:hypothetical protein